VTDLILASGGWIVIVVLLCTLFAPSKLGSNTLQVAPRTLGVSPPKVWLGGIFTQDHSTCVILFSLWRGGRIRTPWSPVRSLSVGKQRSTSRGAIVHLVHPCVHSSAALLPYSCTPDFISCVSAFTLETSYRSGDSVNDKLN
jgi:hypothetical protein